MQQMYPCPNCGAPVPSGKNFCANCGTNLSQFAPRMPPPPPPPQYGYRPPFQQQQQQPPPPYNRQPGWGQQQQGWNQPGPYNQPQPPGGGDPNQYQQQYMYNNPNAPSQPKGSSSSTVFLISLIVLLVGIGGVIFAINSTSLFTSGGSSNPPSVSTPPLNTTPVPSTTPQPTTTPTTTTPQTTAVTAAALIAAYNANASVAGTTYEGKTLDITGTVNTFSTDSGYVIFGDSGIASTKIKCSFSANSVSGISEGQSVTIQGTVANYDDESQFVLVTNCKLK